MSSSERKVIVLCGVVGSGKTYFSSALCSLVPEWKRVSQDDLGSRQACEVAARKILGEGFNVIVDRCNFNKAQRSTWIKIARDANSKVCALELKTPVEKCRQRIMARQNHPTGVVGTFGSSILDRFSQDYRSPMASEGFAKVYSLNMTTDITWNVSTVKIILRQLELMAPTSPTPT